MSPLQGSSFSNDRPHRPRAWPAMAVVVSLLGLATAWSAGVFKIETKDEVVVKEDNDVVRAERETQEPDREPKLPVPFEKPAVEQQPQQPSTTWTSPSTEMAFVHIEGGEFMMGSPDGDNDAEDDEKPQHEVRIGPFYLGATEVTRGQFRRFVYKTGYRTEAETDGTGGHGWNEEKKTFEQDPTYTWLNPGFEQSDEHPVVNVSWNDAVAFCEWLSRVEGRAYRLPTEAEWEYACRARTTTNYFSGDDPESLATVGNVADGTLKEKYPDWPTIAARDGYIYTAPVGRFPANAFRLYDMHGNASEWCQDWYDAEYYKRSPVDDPSGPSGASKRVFRGGALNIGPRLPVGEPSLEQACGPGQRPGVSCCYGSAQRPTRCRRKIEAVWRGIGDGTREG